MKRFAIPLAVVLFLVLVVLVSSLYVVDETKQVVITQFGEPIGEPIVDAGLYFKRPFIQRANYFEKRMLEWDGSPNQIPTKDKRYIWVDTTARWRIADPLKFLQLLRGTLQQLVGVSHRLNKEVAGDGVAGGRVDDVVEDEICEPWVMRRPRSPEVL